MFPGAVKFTAILLVALLVSVPALLAQDATGTPTPDPLLSKATIENQKAQATYYKRQVRPKVWKQVQDMLPAAGASLAAVVALISLALNLRVTLRNQQDTQFYEALKRFGDKDSPQTRSIAAALLAEIASNPRYLETTIDTLFIGLLTERDKGVLNSFATPFSQIVRRNPEKFGVAIDIAGAPSSRLLSIKRNLSHSLAKCLAKYLVNAEKGGEEEDETWKKVKEFTEYDRTRLKNLFPDKPGVGTFADELAAAELVHNGYDSTVDDELKASAQRLRLIEQLLKEPSQVKSRRSWFWQVLNFPQRLQAFLKKQRKSRGSG
jgi:hypothetical protein